MATALMIGLLVVVAFVSVASSLNSHSGKRLLWRKGQGESLPAETDWEVT